MVTIQPVASELLRLLLPRSSAGSTHRKVCRLHGTRRLTDKAAYVQGRVAALKVRESMFPCTCATRHAGWKALPHSVRFSPGAKFTKTMWSSSWCLSTYFLPESVLFLFPRPCHGLRQAFLCYFSFPRTVGVNLGT